MVRRFGGCRLIQPALPEFVQSAEALTAHIIAMWEKHNSAKVIAWLTELMFYPFMRELCDVDLGVFIIKTQTNAYVLYDSHTLRLYSCTIHGPLFEILVYNRKTQLRVGIGILSMHHAVSEVVKIRNKNREGSPMSIFNWFRKWRD